MAPSPMMATTLKASPFRSRAVAMPHAAEMEVAAWPGAEGVVLRLVAPQERGEAVLGADGGEAVVPPVRILWM